MYLEFTDESAKIFNSIKEKDSIETNG